MLDPQTIFPNQAQDFLAEYQKRNAREKKNKNNDDDDVALVI